MAKMSIEESYIQWLNQQNYPAGKKKVVLAAIDLFANDGYNKTSTAKIAKKAGMSEAIIFKYFKTKKALLLEIMKPVVENVFPDLQSNVVKEMQANAITLEKMVRFFLRDRFEFLKKNEQLIRIVQQEFLVNDEFRQMLIDKVKELMEKPVNKAFNEKLHELNPRLDFYLLIRTMGGFLLTYFLQRFVILPNKSIDEEADLELLSKQVVAALKVI